MNDNAHCVICGSTKIVEVRPAEVHRLEDVSFSYSFSPQHTKTFRVVRCEGCTHVFCAPLPGGITTSYEEVTDEEYLKHEESRTRSAEEVIRSIRRSVPGGRLLDVGCATGDFLVAARNAGYQVEGIELSAWSRKIATSRGLTVHSRLLAEHAKQQPGSYDVITLMGVIEHFTNPIAELENINRLLRPGGMLVLWTGDCSSLLAKALGRYWWYWQGQHIQYFTHASMVLAAQKAGLEHERTKLFPFAATRTQITNSLRRYPMHGLLSALVGPFFDRFPIFLKLPGEMLFFATKRSELH